MKAYHLQTRERDKYDPMGMEYYRVDSLYVPERRVLVGFLGWKKGSGLILKYSGDKYLSQAEKIVQGNKWGVMGEVIGETDLTERDIVRIQKNENEFSVKLRRSFDRKTETLVDILTGNNLAWSSKIRKILKNEIF